MTVTYFLGDYTAVDGEKVAALPEKQQEEVKKASKTANQGSLASVAIFPVFMLVCYVALIFYFKGRGGYKPVEI
jgi:cbb3-type cytochrome oxidase subunit 3